MRTQSNATIQTPHNNTTKVNVNQITWTDKDYQEHISLLKTYYKKEREAVKKRSLQAQRIVYGLITYKHKTPLQIERETNIPRQTVYKYINQWKGGEK